MTDNLTMVFASALRREREKAKLTQRELAETAKLTIGHVSALETGRRDPSLRVLGVLATAIGCAPWRLLR